MVAGKGRYQISPDDGWSGFWAQLLGKAARVLAFAAGAQQGDLAGTARWHGHLGLPLEFRHQPGEQRNEFVRRYGDARVVSVPRG